MLLHLHKKINKIKLFITLILLVMFWFCLPKNLFIRPISPVLFSENGHLLSAHIAKDGQWRFPKNEEIPEKFKTAIIEFEDHRFYYHPGIDIIGIGRAIMQNFSGGKVVSGASTIPMQLMRMMRTQKKRSLKNKIIESIFALRASIRYSKEEILRLYVSNAPFGGNVVGLDAATWRYYGKPGKNLSWAESAMLAVLPNAPNLIHPGRNRNTLRNKRNRLLKKLWKKEILDSITYQLAIEEPIPKKPLPMENLAPHALLRTQNLVGSNRNSTLNFSLQKKIQKIVNNHLQILAQKGIFNIGVLVLDVEKNEVKSYIGNTKNKNKKHQNDVDVIIAPRSTGSILKPLLVNFALQDQLISTQSILPDIPTYFNGYTPFNFNEQFDGIAPVQSALTRSLNIPFVHLLKAYNYTKFHHKLQKLNFKNLNKPASHYGLSLILGGGECSLWEITHSFATMARVVQNFNNKDSKYFKDDYDQPRFFKKEKAQTQGEFHSTLFQAGATFLTLDMLKELKRPLDQKGWKYFNTKNQIAWKTGTSFGFRDAWAVGTTPKYALGVWVGNADGEGKADLIGIKAAAPILFDILDILPNSEWFEPPYDDLEEIKICAISGYLPTVDCPTKIINQPIGEKIIKPCTFHKKISIHKEKKLRVNKGCVSNEKIIHKTFFTLPPLQSSYYKTKNPSYQDIPPFLEGCKNENEDNPMQMVYPSIETKIRLPIDIDGSVKPAIFSVTHINMNTKIFWHLNDEFLGATEKFHSMEILKPLGKYKLTLVDENGNKIVKKFQIVE